jgi:phospholipid transport system transporter-binding protein
VIERDGNVLRVSGALTIANVAALCEAGKQKFGDADIVVDLAAATDVDSSALSLMFEWQREARRRNIMISFSNSSDSLLSLAKLYGVSDLISSSA